MLRIQQKLISFSIVSHKIAHNAKDYHKDPTLNFYPVVGLKDIKLGTISLNQPNNQNFLTIEMINQIFRFLNSYHHDHSVENVWIQNRGNMFLGGISYQQLFQNPQYLDKLYKMSVMVAKLNKPIFSYATGGVRNVGAYVLSMASVALTDCTASLRIDQVSKGFIPVAGGSHRLSRLPACIGYYLALTGKKLSSDQMSRLGLITAIVKQGISSKQMRANISKSNLFFRDKIKTIYKDQRDSQWIEWHKILRKQKRFKSQLQMTQYDILKSQQNVFARFTLNQQKIAQINFQNAKKPFNSFSQKPGRNINNYFRMRHQKAFNYLQKEGFIQKSSFQDVRLPGFQMDKILKAFQQDNIIQVIKVLQKDQSQWSQETLKNLRKMDSLAATLTFQLLKRAQSLSWDQCLDLEYTVAKRLLAQSKLTLKQTYTGSKFTLQTKYSQIRIEDLPVETLLQEFFSPAFTQQETLEREVPNFSLLPNADYRDIPDSARLALNQQYFDDIHIGNQGTQMKRWLQNQKIDYRHKSYDIHLLRQKIYNKKQYELIRQNQGKRLELLLNNSKVLKSYVSERFNFIDNMSNQNMQKYLIQTTKTTFNQGIKTRFDEFTKTAAIMGKQKKLQIFKNLRKMLVKKIVLNGLEVEDDDVEKNDYFRGPVYFDKQGKGIFQTKNPNLQLLEPLNKLTEQITQKKQLSEDFIRDEGSLLVDKNLGQRRQISPRQDYLRDVQQKIARRYEQSPSDWTKAYQYQQMIREAAKTSEELAQYLELDTAAIYSVLINAPSEHKTYAQVGQKYIDRLNAERQKHKSTIRTQTVLSQTFSSEFFEHLYNAQAQTTHKSSKFIKQQLIPKFSLTKELQKFIAPVLEQVLRHFEYKYFEEALQDKKVQFGDFDRYIYQARDKQFVQFYKNDILFVYSYFAILKVKDILHSLKINGVPQKRQELIGFFKQYNIQFQSDRTLVSINLILSKFLFNMLDLHTYTKAKIRLPQSKLLDFLNRTKISRQTQKKSLYPLSFEGLLLMIGKDRTKLYNKVVHEFIPSQPQYLLQMAHNNTKNQLDDQTASKGSHASSLYVFQNTVTPQHLQKKTLIAGYQYYLALFDSFIQRASGKYNFVNDQTLALDPHKLKIQMGNILNLKQTNQQWFERISSLALRNFFKTRLEYEKTLTKGQLLAFDQQMREILNPQTFRLVLKYILQSQIQQTKALFTQVRHYQYSKNESDLNEQMYCDIRRNVKNPDAFKRLNNLRMAMTVQSDYYRTSQNRISSQQEKEDLVEEKKQFHSYERFPRQTYKRVVHQAFTYGEEKNFNKYLDPIKDRQMDHKQYARNLRFTEDQRQTNFKQDTKFTDFEDQIKSLKTSINKNSNGPQVQSIYKKLEQLL